MVFCVSCSTVPKLMVSKNTLENPSPDSFAAAFLDRPCRMVHSIEARFGSRSMYVLGVTVADPFQRTLDSAILTIEGLVVFEARYADGTVTIRRSIDHFKSQDFAMAMMKDIMLIFFPPEYSSMTTGRGINNTMICRYYIENDILDIELTGLKAWSKKLYRDKKLIKEITASDLSEQGLTKKLVLESRAGTDYTLHMNLIEAEAVR